MAFEKGNQLSVGRPNPGAAFRKTCRAVVDSEVIRRWTDEVREKGENWVRCSELLAAYGYGKPSQSIEVSGSVEHHAADLSPDERLRIIDRLRADGSSEVAH